MLSISVPLKNAGDQAVLTKHSDRGDFFSFPISDKPVLFTGSRYSGLDRMTCDLLIQYFAMLDYGFVVGCDAGVDRAFRLTLSHSEYADRSLVACVNRSKFRYTYGIRAQVVAPVRFSLESVIFHRSMWLAKNTSCGIIFPDHPFHRKWDTGQQKLFMAYLSHLKPVFMVTEFPPDECNFYKIIPTSLNGIVRGFWIVPVLIGREHSGTEPEESYPHKLLENPLCRE